MKHRKSLLMLILFLLLAMMGATLTSGCAKESEVPTQIIKDITAQEAFSLIQENRGNSDFIIVDVRTPQEFADGHIQDAVNIDFQSDNFRNEIDRLDKDKIYLIYCRSGNRSRGALDIMVELKFMEVYHLYEGIIGWNQLGYSIVK